MLNTPLRSRACAWLLLFACLGLPPLRGDDAALRGDDAPKSAAPAPTHLDAPLIAIGDVHGDLRAVVRLLLELGLIDTRGRWTGGSRHLVQTGDLLDRGADSRHVVDLFRSLQSEAKEAGGRVTVLLGNHEVMSLVGDLRSVSAAEYADWATVEDPELRARGKKELLGRIRSGSALLRSRYYPELATLVDERSFDSFFPPGYFARREAMSPTGSIGGWLSKLPIVHVERRTLFVHAGVSPGLARLDSSSLDRLARRELEEFLRAVSSLERDGVFDGALGFSELFRLIAAERTAGGPHPELRERFETLERIRDHGLLFAEDGLVWYRGLALDPERALERSVDKLLARHDVDRLVIGHTQPESLRIEARFRGRVLLIDTGMNSDYFGGVPSALWFAGDAPPKPFALTTEPPR